MKYAYARVSMDGQSVDPQARQQRQPQHDFKTTVKGGSRAI
jgi:hypothetical protein